MQSLAHREDALRARLAAPDNTPLEEQYGRIRMQQEIRSRALGQDLDGSQRGAALPPAAVVFRRGEVRGLTALRAESRRAGSLEATLFGGERPAFDDLRVTNCVKVCAASDIFSLQRTLTGKAQAVRPPLCN